MSHLVQHTKVSVVRNQTVPIDIKIYFKHLKCYSVAVYSKCNKSFIFQFKLNLPPFILSVISTYVIDEYTLKTFEFRQICQFIFLTV
jgi:hypothetical protein